MILINSSPRDTMRIFRPFSRVNVPVGVGSLAAVLDRERIKYKIIDEQIEGNTFDLISEYVKGLEKPYIFGFSVLTSTFKRAVMVSRHLKEIYPDSVVIFGGIHPTAVPEEVLMQQHIDIVLRGEAEKILPRVYRCLKDKCDISSIDNISYKLEGRIICNNIMSFVEDLDSLPPFPYHHFSPVDYDLGSVVSSRGCPYKCIFCSNRVSTGRDYRYRSADYIVDEIDLLYHKYGKQHILLLDDNFVVNKKRVYMFLDKLKERKLEGKLNYTFQARGDNVDYEILKDLYSAGFSNISFGLETGSERIMRLIKKDETVQQCFEAVRLAKEIGFHVSGVFIYGFPNETHEERLSCVKMSKKLNIDLIRFNNATPYPGTELYEIAKRENRLNKIGLYENFNSVSAIIENPFKRITFSYVPYGSSEAEIRNDILLSYLLFYLNISKIKMMLFTKSGATKRWFNVGTKTREIYYKIPALVYLGIVLTIKFSCLFFNILIKRNVSVSLIEFISMFRKGWSDSFNLDNNIHSLCVSN